MLLGIISDGHSQKKGSNTYDLNSQKIATSIFQRFFKNISVTFLKLPLLIHLTNTRGASQHSPNCLSCCTFYIGGA